MDNLVIIAVTLLLGLVFVVPYIRKVRQRERRNKEKLAAAESAGLNEPPSLHPKIDPRYCIGCNACVVACPEKDILGLVNGKAALINASRCVGHGMCAAACPVDAIDLVFGTAERGVDIPHVQGNFETNVAGIYIVGELGGMGLIRNAFRQGRQAVEDIAKNLRSEAADIYDLLIVGAGPGGIAASLTAMELKLNFITIEQEGPGGAARHYPRQKLVMTQPMEIPLYGQVDIRQISKEELLELWEQVLAKTGLQIQTGEKVEAVNSENGLYRVKTSAGEYLTQRVVLAIGRRGIPRKLGVPGEDSAKVAYALLEPEQFNDSRILVVGGGNSALEAAWALVRQGRGNTVTLSYRGEAFARAQEENRARIEELAEGGDLQVLFKSNVQTIGQDQVDIDIDGELETLPNDFVFVFAGGELPTELMRTMGIAIERKFGEA
ncbi:MAG: 4Fe-4S dicluster domain-containing protein [Candidatus Latescibacteria bacterium]|nr:4Fe-4S dicluster domain-containing protein [Candidatus Latescibacterota bacterium]